MNSNLQFELTWDYRCPFARNASEHVIAAKSAGVEWDITFVPFSLTQAHLDDDQINVWDDPNYSADRLAVEVGIVVQKLIPESFEKVHLELFATRHDHAKDLTDVNVIRSVLSSQGVDEALVFDAIEDGWPREQFRKSHQEAVDHYGVFGVPTFITGEQAGFVRLMTRPFGDSEAARSNIERILDLLRNHSEINEFKRTKIEL